MLMLGIETTCDETSAAVVREGREVLSNVVASQVDLHAKFGGVVPEVAARAHLESLNVMVQEALQEAGVTRPSEELSGVAVSHCPGLIGCLLVGVAGAKGYAFGWGVPLVGVNHVQAHLYSVMLGEKGEIENRKLKIEKREVEFPAVGLVMSGGHSSLYHVHSFDNLRRIGATQDDAVGEAFDKVAAILQMGYPGGPLIDALSTEGDPRAIKFPAGHLEKDSLNFSFSGLKTAVLYYVNGKKGRERDASWMSRQQKADVAASFQRTAAEMLVEKLRRAAGRYETRSIIVGGGVSANRGIRAAVAELGRELGVPVHVPAMKYTTDNGAMVAGMGTEMLRKGRVAGMGLETVATV
jgi:N6-L-threonylcarbamoyladenine synthase